MNSNNNTDMDNTQDTNDISSQLQSIMTCMNLLQNQINGLQDELKDIKQQLSLYNKNDNDNVVDLNNRIEILEHQMNEINNQFN